MMNLDNIKQVYLVGIGGIGMSGLARWFKHRGCVVAGYDRTSTPLTKELEAEGINITYVDEIAEIPSSCSENNVATLIIFTPAIPKDSLIKNYFINKGFALKKRSEVLGIISESLFTIAVAGTHGKTTTSTIIAHLLKASGHDCSAFLGGISGNYNTNVLFGTNSTLVVEADEYDRSFLTLHPDIAIITSMDADHLDIYGDKSHLEESFRLFATQLKQGGVLIKKEGIPLSDAGTSYGVERGLASAINVKVEHGAYYFDYKTENILIKNLSLGLAGLHNVENAVAAITVALQMGIDEHKIREALASFKGVKRRFEYIVNDGNKVFIDDYAHHPEELKACINSVKQLYPGKKITAVFQPHLFTRTRDFADGFAESLSLADELILLDIYPARELPIEGVNSQMILDKVKLQNKFLYTKKELLEKINDHHPEILLTVGAGDIDQLVEPLREKICLGR